MVAHAGSTAFALYRYRHCRRPNAGFIKKLVTRESLAKSQAGTGETSTLYYRKARECEGKDLSRIKLYEYS